MTDRTAAFRELKALHMARVDEGYHNRRKAPPRGQPRTEPIRELNRIRIVESGEPLIELVNEEHGVFLCCDRRIWVRKTVAEMLFRAQESLPRDVHLFLFEGFRSLERQRIIYERFWQQSLIDHPTWPDNIRRREINRMVAPPDVKCPPGHCTGGAVDTTLVTPDGRELDLISPCEDRFGMDCTATWSGNCSATAIANRKVLCEAVEAQGFRNYPFEWWHYSYGDSGWAFRKGRKTCLYGAAPAPPEYEMPTVEPA